MSRSLLICGLALALLIAAWRRRGNRLKARTFNGNAVVGDNAGTINQSYNASTGGEPKPDRVGQTTAIVGVPIAAAQAAHDFYK